MKKRFLLLVLVLQVSVLTLTAQEQPVYSWSFDRATDFQLPRDGSSHNDSIAGNYSLVEGVDGGKALLLDGFTTAVHIDPAEQLMGSFSIEAWLSQAAYPWNWAPILTHKSRGARPVYEDWGYYFGVGPAGQLGMDLWIGSELYRCITSDFTLELYKWNHVAVTFKEKDGIYLYCNGEQVGFTPVGDSFTGPFKTELRIGMNEKPVKPSNIVREYGTLPYDYSIDGAIDNLKVYNTSIEKEAFAYDPKAQLPADGSLVRRKMPEVPNRDKFGAFYTKLKYYKEWDQLWPVAGHTDIVVTFENSPARLVFWRGSRYSAVWVSEDDFWMGDQSVEAWEDIGKDAEGCYEHMQDRHCRYSHVRILESTPARVLVHWRYAPVSAYNSLWRPDPKTGWACWVDEYYYVYPDGSAIRHVQWKKGSLGFPRQFQESLGFTGPGQTRGDILEIEWLTVTNHKGEKQEFTFRENPDLSKDIWTPESFNIQKHNFKSEYDPFIIFEEGNVMFGLQDKDMADYNRPGKYNHWPVGQAYCDGRGCVATDRPAHFITFPISDPEIHQDETREWWDGLYGMTSKPTEELIKISKSWNNAPKIKRSDNRNLFYDKSQRAYIEENFSGNKLLYKVEASKESPVENIVIIISNTAHNGADILLNGRVLNPKDYRVGIVDNGLKQGMIIWIDYQSEKKFDLEIRPSEK